jgi:hypothetical protein
VAGETKTLDYNVHSNATNGEAAAIQNCGWGLLPLYPGTVLYGSAAYIQAGDAWTIEGVYYEVPISSP